MCIVLQKIRVEYRSYVIIQLTDLEFDAGRYSCYIPTASTVVDTVDLRFHGFVPCRIARAVGPQ